MELLKEQGLERPGEKNKQTNKQKDTHLSLETSSETQKVSQLQEDEKESLEKCLFLIFFNNCWAVGLSQKAHPSHANSSEQLQVQCISRR